MFSRKIDWIADAGPVDSRSQFRWTKIYTLKLLCGSISWSLRAANFSIKISLWYALGMRLTGNIHSRSLNSIKLISSTEDSRPAAHYLLDFSAAQSANLYRRKIRLASPAFLIVLLFPRIRFLCSRIPSAWQAQGNTRGADAAARSEIGIGLKRSW